MSDVLMQSGNLVFCHGKNLISRGIRLAQWVRFKNSQITHVAVLSAPTLDKKDWIVIQARSHGVEISLLSLLQDESPIILAPPDSADRMALVTFMKAQVGDRYGFVTILSILVTMLLPGALSVMKSNTWICSAVAGEAMRFGGWYHSWGNIYQITPAQLYDSMTTQAERIALGKRV